MRRYLIVLAFVLLGAGLSFAQEPLSTFAVSERRTLEVNGVERIYSIYVPETLDGPAPLVVALHGRFSSGKAFEATTQLSRHAAENGWMVVYPQAYEYSWEDGGRELGLPRVGNNPQDDTAFIEQLVSAVSADHEVSHLSLVGFDTGGSMVERLLCESDLAISSVMLVSAVGWSYNADQCGEQVIQSDILLVYGVFDRVYKPTGEELADFPQPDGSLIRRFGFYETAQFWAAQADCEAAPEQIGLTSVFQNCAGDATVAAMLLSDLAHDWPRSGAYQATTNTAPENDGGALLAALIGDALPVEITEPVELIMTPRTFLAYVPTGYTGQEPMPVLFALHGRPDSGAGFATITDLSRVAEEHGFIVVFPDGVDNQWNYLGGIMQGEMFNTPDDVAFLNALVDDLAIDLNIDLSRVYLTGFSNGGFMTYRMACNPTPNRFAGYAVAGALMYPEMELMCLAAPPRPLLVEHGTEDISISWEGITHMPQPGTLAVTRTVLQSVSFWAARNGCVEAGAQRTDIPPSDDQTSVVQFDFGDCASEMPIRFFAVMGGGHGWPGVDNLRHEIAGKVNMDINLGEEIWTFMKDFRLPED